VRAEAAYRRHLREYRSKGAVRIRRLAERLLGTAAVLDCIRHGPEEHGSRRAYRLNITREIENPCSHDIEREREALFAWLTHTLSLQFPRYRQSAMLRIQQPQAWPKRDRLSAEVPASSGQSRGSSPESD
jgi:hypothetical protein